MATFNKIQAFVEHMAEGVHDLGADQLVLCMTANANAIVATNTILGNLTQISYTNASTRNLTTSASAQSSGTYKLTINDIVITASGGTVGPFQQVGVFNDTPTSPVDPLVCWHDYGSDLTLADTETFTWDADGTNGLLQVA